MFLSVNYHEQKNADPDGPQFLDAQLPACRSVSTRRRARPFPGFISTGDIGNPRVSRLRAVDRRSAAAAASIRRATRRRSDTGHQAAQPLRLGALPDQQRLAGLRDRPATRSQETRFVIQPMPLSDQISRPPTPSGASRRSCCRRPARSIRTRRRIAAGVDGQPLNVRYRCVEMRQPRHDRHQRGVADRRGREGHARGTGTSTRRSTTARTRPRRC